ncbi:MAG: nucleotidyltransferase domain-containing protein [Thermodesulfobacteriota bacterium]
MPPDTNDGLKEEPEKMFNIEEHLQDIEKICRELRVKRLDLVGSASRDDFQPEKSDIDVLIEFDGLDRLFDRYFELKTRLEKQLGRRVDVIQESAVKNPYVRMGLNRRRVQIYGS